MDSDNFGFHKYILLQMEGIIMNVKIIGVGAAGNKAAIKAVEERVVREDDIILMNTTLQDIPMMYKGRSLLFGPKNFGGGCGKERNRSKEFICKCFEESDGSDTFGQTIQRLLSPDDLVVIVTSTEGGTGSGSAPLLASYISEVIGVRPQLIAFTGTEDDLRGLQNTLDFFKDCSEYCSNCIIQAISNKKFMEEAGNNKLKAEQLANTDFVSRIKVLQGSMLHESTQNIDAMDHMKLVTTAGYMSIASVTSQEAIEDVAQFNELCKKMFSSSKSLSTGSDRCVRLGIILTISEEDKDSIDWGFTNIKNQFAEIGEVFLHVQPSIDETRQIICVMCGMEMPIKFVNATYEKFKARMSKSAKQTNFASTMASIDTNNSLFDFDKPATAVPKVSNSAFLQRIKNTETSKNPNDNNPLGNY